MKKRILICAILYVVYVDLAVWGQKTYLDSPQNILLLRSLRRLIFAIVGRTGTERYLLQSAVNTGKVQTRIPENVSFPCDVSVGKSRNVPTSVHRLRPGDIEVVGAMGDSLIAGAGALGTRILHILIENRGVSALGGGQGSWRQYLTIPNILKEFNPNLYGYCSEDCLAADEASKFNVAETGAMTIDMPYMAEVLVKRIKSDPRVNVDKHWKLISVMVGANNFCLEICYRESPWSLIEEHKANLLRVLRFVRDNLPRTLISIVNTPNLQSLVETTERSLYAKISVDFECPCLMGLAYRKKRELYYEIIKKWQNVEHEVTKYPEFKRDDFAAVCQPFTKYVAIPLRNGVTDFSYFAPDTFHVSQKTFARYTNALWNNMLQPSNEKTIGWLETFVKFLCPTLDRPYISTLYN